MENLMKGCRDKRRQGFKLFKPSCMPVQTNNSSCNQKGFPQKKNNTNLFCVCVHVCIFPQWLREKIIFKQF